MASNDTHTDADTATDATDNAAATDTDATTQDATANTDASSLDTIIDTLIGSVGDDSRVTDMSAFRAVVSRASDVFTKVGSSIVRLTNHYKEAAETAMELAPLVLRPNGYPDWSRSTDVSKKVWSFLEDKALPLDKVSAEDRKRAKDAVNQHVGRTYRLPAIAWYVLRTDNALADERRAAEESPAAFRAIFENPPDRLKAGVLDQIRHQVSENGNALLQDPTSGPYAPVTTDGQNTTTNPSDQRRGRSGQNADQIVARSAESAKLLTPLHAVKLVAGSIIAASPKILAGGEIEGRPECVELLHDISGIAHALAKHLDGKTTEEDVTDLKVMIVNATKHLSAATLAELTTDTDAATDTDADDDAETTDDDADAETTDAETTDDAETVTA